MKIVPKDNNEKQEQMLFYLKFGTVMLWIDGRVAEVQLPEHLRTTPQVRLNFDYGFEASDIRILPERIEARLSFGTMKFSCVIPMEAVYMMTSEATDTGCIFPTSVPQEMAELFLSPLFNSPPLEKPVAETPRLELKKETSEVAPQSRSHLRLIK